MISLLSAQSAQRVFLLICYCSKLFGSKMPCINRANFIVFFFGFFFLFFRAKQCFGTIYTRMEMVFMIQDMLLVQYWLAINGWQINGYTKEDRNSVDLVAFMQTNNEILSLSRHSSQCHLDSQKSSIHKHNVMSIIMFYNYHVSTVFTGLQIIVSIVAKYMTNCHFL